MSTKINPAPLPLGTVICGYSLESVVGHGGFGITYLGKEQTSGELVVIKENLPESCVSRAEGEYAVTVLPGKGGSDKGAFEWATGAFFNEAQTLASLDHPSVIKVLRAFHADATGTDYYVMPYIKGKSLADAIQIGVRPTREWLLYIMAALLDALAYVHGKGFLHRDIKPDNVLLEENGRPMLIDFGASRPMSKCSNTVVLTLNYCPVEQKRGSGEGPYTDVYALGATLYHLVSGRQVPPFEFRVGAHDQFKPLVSDPELVNTYGQAVLASIDKAVGVEPEDRYPNAMVWAEALKDEPGFQTSAPVLLDMSDGGAALPTFGHNIEPIAVTAIPIGPAPAARNNRLAAALCGGGILALVGVLAWVCYDQFCSGGRAAATTETAAAIATPPAATTPPAVEPAAVEPAAVEPAAVPEVPSALADELGDAGTPGQTPADSAAAPQRVLARPDSFLYATATSQDAIGDQLPLYAVFYVKGESGDRYEVSELPGGESVGWLNKADSHKWNNNLALQFTHPGGILKRDPALFFDTWEHSQSYFRMPESRRRNIIDRVKAKMQPDAGIGLVAKEPEKWSPHSHYSLLPVLEFKQVKELDDGDRPKDELYLRTVALNYTGMPDGGGSAAAAAQHVAKNKPLVDIVYVVDTSRSMQPYIETICNYLSQKAGYISQQTEDRARFGFVGYQDFSIVGGAVNERLCDYVTHVYTPEKMLTAREFAAMSGSIQATKKDSIDYAEDVLAGVKTAMDKIPWRKGSIRIIYVVGDTCGRSGNVNVGDRESDSLRNCDIKTWRKRARGSITGFTPIQIRGLCESAVNREEKSSNYAILPMYILAPPVHDTRSGKPRPLFQEREWKVKCNISQQAWNSHILEGITFFHALSVDHDQIKDVGVTGPDGAVTVYSLDDVSGDIEAYFSDKLKIELQVRPFDVAFGESMDDIIQQAGNPEEVAPKSDPKAKYSAAQSLFQSAYLEWCAVNGQEETDAEGRMAEIHGWTSAQDASERDVVKAGVVLSRKQLDSLAVSLSDFVEQLQSGDDADSVTESMDALFNLMVLTTTDPNLDPAVKMPQPTISAYVRNLPWHTTMIQLYEATIGNGDEITPQQRNELVKQLFAKYEYLRTLGESGNWTKDSTDRDKDLIAIPLDQLP